MSECDRQFEYAHMPLKFYGLKEELTFFLINEFIEESYD